ncbi:MAG: SurA N-terminal domain-containing protein [Rickettsiales bacterium]|jgi:peptidyl-prolyl cis-trans isomerase D|nr:SurA N-terminal domain-containing protein [Rickettsiales bacterium]
MLKYLRDASNRPVAKFLMGILIFSFVGWGAANWILGETQTDDAVLRIGSAPLKLAQFEQERSRQLSAMTREQQKQIYTDHAMQVYFSQQILSKLSSQIMVGLRANALGLSVTNSFVAGAIRAEPAFQSGGRFDSAKFDAMLYNSGLSESAFADWMRANELRDMLITAVSALPNVPDFAVTAAYNARYSTRKIEFATVRFDDFKVALTPNSSQIAETYAKNQKTIPEFRSISYVLVPAKMSEPDDYDRAYASAQKLEDAIIGGESMSNAAAKFKAKFMKLPNIDAERTVRGGAAVTDPILNDSIISLAFSLDEGMESEIIETKSGFAIFRVEKIEYAHIAEMESMEKELAEMWKRDEQKKSAYLKANEVLAAANAKGKSIGSGVTVTRASGAPIEVLSAAFANEPGTKTIVPGRDAFYVLWVKESITPKMDAGKKSALQKEAANMLARTVTDDYSAFLSRKYPVKINNRLFKRLFGEK